MIPAAVFSYVGKKNIGKAPESAEFTVNILW
jgi:hypothetical protein